MLFYLKNIVTNPIIPSCYVRISSTMTKKGVLQSDLKYLNPFLIDSPNMTESATIFLWESIKLISLVITHEPKPIIISTINSHMFYTSLFSDLTPNQNNTFNFL